jgi:hypothetical protein
LVPLRRAGTLVRVEHRLQIHASSLTQ